VGKREKLKRDLQSEIIGVILIAVAVFSITVLFTSKGGVIGSIISKNLKGLTGLGAVFFPVFIAVTGFMMIFYKTGVDLNLRFIGIIIIFAVFITYFHLEIQQMQDIKVIDRLKEGISLGLTGRGGGFLGALFAVGLVELFGVTGAQIFLSAVVLIGFLLSANLTINSIFKAVLMCTKTLFLLILKVLRIFNFRNITMESGKNSDGCEIASNINEPLKCEDIIHDEIKITPPAPTVHEEPLKDELLKDEPLKDESPIIIQGIPHENIGDKYQPPPVNLLKKNIRKKGMFTQREILSNVKLLENTFENFGIKVKVLQVSCGPTVTRYEVQPAPGIKVSRIVALSDDIALGLAAQDVRIEAPIPGKAAIGIEIPNKEITQVLFRDVIDTKEFQKHNGKLTISLGKDIAGNPVIADLQDMPHLLVAGATGSGKSVCINCIITSLIFKSSPKDVRFLLIDPKVVELSNYNGIPHLLCPVITDPKKAAGALNWVVKEMERRYQIFAQEGVKDIQRYQLKNLMTQESLPQVVVIIDELSDLMMVAPNDVEDAICRLAQMARAAGIYLVVATQRPSVDVITGLIKANIPSRISFAVSSQVDSRTILDMSGAEKLLGKGDMLFYPVGASKPLRVQGAFISEKEVDDIVNFVKKQGEPVYLDEISDEKTQEKKCGDNVDELFQEALKLIVESGQASVSILQRRLHIGYTRAARLIDQMEEKGYIGGYEGTKPREVKITQLQYDNIFNKR
jgi:S-DNA-T family DNA segregation ATPase FtsK/SpoIIIE